MQKCSWRNALALHAHVCRCRRARGNATRGSRGKGRRIYVSGFRVDTISGSEYRLDGDVQSARTEGKTEKKRGGCLVG